MKKKTNHVPSESAFFALWGAFFAIAVVFSAEFLVPGTPIAFAQVASRAVAYVMPQELLASVLGEARRDTPSSGRNSSAGTQGGTGRTSTSRGSTVPSSRSTTNTTAPSGGYSQSVFGGGSSINNRGSSNNSNTYSSLNSSGNRLTGAGPGASANRVTVNSFSNQSTLGTYLGNLLNSWSLGSQQPRTAPTYSQPRSAFDPVAYNNSGDMLSPLSGYNIVAGAPPAPSVNTLVVGRPPTPASTGLPAASPRTGSYTVSAYAQPYQTSPIAYAPSNQPIDFGQEAINYVRGGTGSVVRNTTNVPYLNTNLPTGSAGLISPTPTQGFIYSTPTGYVTSFRPNPVSVVSGEAYVLSNALQNYNATAPVIAITERIASGSRGPQVIALQTHLANQGLYSIDMIDGIAGPRTVAAIRAYQARNGLALVDGVVGENTLAALHAEANRAIALANQDNTPALFDLSLLSPQTAARYNALRTVESLTSLNSPANIRAWQTALRAAGYDPGSFDGVRGPQTRAAEEAFFRNLSGNPQLTGLGLNNTVIDPSAVASAVRVATIIEAQNNINLRCLECSLTVTGVFDLATRHALARIAGESVSTYDPKSAGLSLPVSSAGVDASQAFAKLRGAVEQNLSIQSVSLDAVNQWRTSATAGVSNPIQREIIERAGNQIATLTAAGQISSARQVVSVLNFAEADITAGLQSIARTAGAEGTTLVQYSINVAAAIEKAASLQGQESAEAYARSVTPQPVATVQGSFKIGFLVSGSSFTVPTDWNPSANVIEVIGGGAGGSGSRYGGGGGGGAYSRITNLALTPGATVTYKVGTGGGAGASGTDTYFNGVACASSPVCAKGGATGNGGAGGAGGSETLSIGDIKYSGGKGGTSIGGSNAGNGGGAAGPFGIGGAGGGSLPEPNGHGGAGGAGKGGIGANGVTGAVVGEDKTGNVSFPGGNGAEWGNAGSGGGGASHGFGGDGGYFGGGGAGRVFNTGSAGAGAQGLIVILYVSVPSIQSALAPTPIPAPTPTVPPTPNPTPDNSISPAVPPKVSSLLGTVTRVDRTTYPERTTVFWSRMQEFKNIPVGFSVYINGKKYTTTVNSTVGNIYLPKNTPVAVGDSVSFTAPAPQSSPGLTPPAPGNTNQSQQSPPPNETPPTPAPDNTGVVPTTYKFSTGFSSVQGTNNWFYQSSGSGTYTNMTWDAPNSRWKGSETYLLVAATYMHPGVNADSVIKWIAPKAGTIEIKGTVGDTNAVCGDGVIATVIKGGASLWQETIPNGAGLIPNQSGFNVIPVPAKSHTLTTTVAAGDSIYFIVNKKGENTCDGTTWDPTVTYQS